MKFGIFNKFGALNSAPIFDAFCRGLDRLGHSWQTHDQTADVAVIWSVLWHGRMKANQSVWHQYRSSNRPVIVLEVGMIQRGHTWKMGINGIGLSAGWPNATDPNRAARLGISADPWRSSGKDIMIAAQRSYSQQWHDMPPMDRWIANTVDQVRQHSDRPIRIRCHPRQRIQIPPGCAGEHPQKIAGTYDNFDFESALSRAWCVINWNSGPGCQAVIKGVPAFVGQDSLAAPVGNLDWTQIENPRRPDRDQWLCDLAHTEWTGAEIASGIPIAGLLHRIESC